tara:strand:+ start:326 stop:511 length:186 start_codon:yes stop_codon:yes gene_type:complete
MEKNLDSVDIQKLREASLIDESEIALKIGDLIIAENVITKVRRVLDTGSLLLESNRRLLRD